MRTIVCLGALLLSAACGAHERLSSVTWCAGGTVRTTGTFSFSAQDLADYSACLHSGACIDNSAATPIGSTAAKGGSCSTMNCGQFDDDYGVAARMADYHCAAFAYRPASPAIRDEGSVLPMITAPASYNGSTHHSDFRLRQGLSGTCAVCIVPRSPVVVPATQ